MGGDFTKMTVTDHHVMCIPPTVTRHHVARIPFEDSGLLWCNNKFKKTTAIFYKACHVLTEKALYVLYCSLALPYMTYFAEICGNTYRPNVLYVF